MYHGPERRKCKDMLSEDDKEFLVQTLSSRSSDKRFFGFKVQELSIIATILFGIFAFYLRTDEAMRRLIGITDFLVEFTQNSDNYHSSITGKQFFKGKPVSLGYITQVRDNHEG